MHNYTERKSATQTDVTIDTYIYNINDTRYTEKYAVRYRHIRH